MTVSFYPPSYRAAASDLTIAISPLGLVELADEEFEVHGPRLNRYASNWAWFLGYHWAYKREIGEPQLTFNWVKAFSEYLTNFSFGKPIHFHSPEATAAIIPYMTWQHHAAASNQWSRSRTTRQKCRLRSGSTLPSTPLSVR